MIDDATTDQDMRVPPSNHFEKLRGNLAGFHSIRVNRQWRRVLLTTKRKPATVGEILLEEFMQPEAVEIAAPSRPGWA